MSNLEKLSFADQVDHKVKQIYGLSRYDVKHTAPDNQNIITNDINIDEQSESCSCDSCHCEICVAEENNHSRLYSEDRYKQVSSTLYASPTPNGNILRMIQSIQITTINIKFGSFTNL